MLSRVLKWLALSTPAAPLLAAPQKPSRSRTAWRWVIVDPSIVAYVGSRAVINAQADSITSTFGVVSGFERIDVACSRASVANFAEDVEFRACIVTSLTSSAVAKSAFIKQAHLKLSTSRMAKLCSVLDEFAVLSEPGKDGPKSVVNLRLQLLTLSIEEEVASKRGGLKPTLVENRIYSNAVTRSHQGQSPVIKVSIFFQFAKI